jgi:hypothetical protein
MHRDGTHAVTIQYYPTDHTQPQGGLLPQNGKNMKQEEEGEAFFLSALNSETNPKGGGGGATMMMARAGGGGGSGSGGSDSGLEGGGGSGSSSQFSWSTVEFNLQPDTMDLMRGTQVINSQLPAEPVPQHRAPKHAAPTPAARKRGGEVRTCSAECCARDVPDRTRGKGGAYATVFLSRLNRAIRQAPPPGLRLRAPLEYDVRYKYIFGGLFLRS